MLIDGGIAVDDRGKISFVNEFDFEDVKRFYVVENHRAGFVRAWHGHKDEGKYVYVVAGTAIVAYVPMEGTWKLTRHVLSAAKPQILYIPPGHYNGFKTLTNDAKVIFFATHRLDESLDDDDRLEPFRWEGVWEVKDR